MKNFQFLYVFIAILLFSCSKDESLDQNQPQPSLEYGLGLNNNDDQSKVPLNVNISYGNGNLPSSYDLSDKMPPIGNQGQYGTCVAWAVAYNMKTSINAIEKGYTTSDIADPNKQFSPKDLFINLENSQKGKDCAGTGFTEPLTLLQERGTSTMAQVPYTDLGNCDKSLADPSWDEFAKNNKIKYWRRVQADINSIKQNISSNIPIVFGAKLSDNFMSWNSSDVISSNTTFNGVGQHAYHAMLIAGYDDNMGANGALRVVNSWGDVWGDVGYIWIDYQYFINEFLMKDPNGNANLYIAENLQGDEKVPDKDDSTPKNGVDLASWVYTDYSLYGQGGAYNERLISYDIFNIGTADLKSSSKVGFHYYIINPYDVSDYMLIFKDELTDAIQAGTYECPNSNECYINIDISKGSSFASMAGWNSVDRTYFLPEVTGEYYVVLVADAAGIISEGDEQNNLYFSAPYPIYIDGGLITQVSQENGELLANPNDKFSVSDSEKRNNISYRSTDKLSMSNAYTNEEIIKYLKNEIKHDKHINHMMSHDATAGIQ